VEVLSMYGVWEAEGVAVCSGGEVRVGWMVGIRQ
jgi:hypothetical protein